MVLDGARLAVGGEFDMASGLPLLIVHADEDYALPYSEASRRLRRRRRRRSGSSPSTRRPTPSRTRTSRTPPTRWSQAVTIAFWDRWLKEDEAAEERLAEAVTPATLASLESDLG